MSRNAIMRASFGRGLAAVSLLSIAACATPQTVFDHSAASDIKTIGVLTPKFPAKPTVFLASSVGQSFGLVGALVDAQMQDNRENHVVDLYAAQKFDPQSVFWGHLRQEIGADGYHLVDVAADRSDGDYVKAYPAGGPKVDAYLDVVVGSYGYLAAGIHADEPYRPYTAIKLKLIRASDGTVLMEDQITYNPINGGDAKAVNLSPDPRYAFDKFDDLQAQPQLAVEGETDALSQVAHNAALLLK